MRQGIHPERMVRVMAKSNYEQLQKARRKLKKWHRKATKAVAGADYQYATIKLREWENAEDYWFNKWQDED